MNETTIEGFVMKVPWGGNIPEFGKVDIIGSHLQSDKERRQFQADETLFRECIFDGPRPVNPRGCINCIFTRRSQTVEEE